MNIFLFSIIANIVGALFVSWLVTKTKLSAVPFPNEGVVRFPNPKKIAFASSCVLMAWLCMLASLFSILVMFAGIESKLFLIVSIFSLLFMSAVYLISGIQLKCVNCKKRVFVQVVEKPPHSVKFKGLTGWSSVVLQVLVLKKFTCMHCGQVHTLK
jgi:hypothetical protein